jgi:hypothetical protein
MHSEECQDATASQYNTERSSRLRKKWIKLSFGADMLKQITVPSK